MEISERAKQFGAFAAVKGFEKELRKREEIFEKKAILSDEKNAELDFMLRETSVGDEIIVTHYLKNRYVKTVGVLKCISKREKSLYLMFLPEAKVPSVRFLSKRLLAMR